MSLKREYVLRVIWTKDKDEIEHLSEEYSDAEKVQFEVFGTLVEPPEAMQKILRKINSDTLGIC